MPANTSYVLPEKPHNPIETTIKHTPTLLMKYKEIVLDRTMNPTEHKQLTVFSGA